MERLPSARGPHSRRPWNQPITLPSEIACAVRLQSAASSPMRSIVQAAASKSARRSAMAVAIWSGVADGPQ